MGLIKNLTPDSKGVTCLVRLLEEPKEVQVAKKNGGSLTFWEVKCGDESGQVTLSLTEAQKGAVTKDKVVVIRNGAVKMVNGFVRLAVDRWGKIDVDTTEVVEK